jgi:hypothetical protein
MDECLFFLLDRVNAPYSLGTAVKTATIHSARKKSIAIFTDVTDFADKKKKGK